MSSFKQEEQPKFRVYDRCYKRFDPVNISEHFASYNGLLRESAFQADDLPKKSELLFNLIGDGINDEKYEILGQFCSVDHLSVDGEMDKVTRDTFDHLKEPLDELAIDKLSLKTLEFAKLRHSLPTYRLRSKYTALIPITYEKSLAKIPLDQTLKPSSDILVSIKIYNPFFSKMNNSTCMLGTKEKSSLDIVVEIAGSQTLDKLRDIITCKSDFSISTDVSDNLSLVSTAMAKDVYNSGFFFIEDTFYNDFRDPANKDNSTCIRKWMEEHKLGFAKTAKMEETRIDSLVVSFGYPFVYQHQGDCEHLICFSDARLVNAFDDLNINCYPRITRCKQIKSHLCMTCGIYIVKWIVRNSDRVPLEPCLLCDNCFKSYNYIKDKKVGSFKAYPYPENASLKTITFMLAQEDLESKLN